MTTVKICAWCKKDLSPNATAQAAKGALISHGMCKPCMASMLEKEA